jgi:hypothetical protein
MQLKTAIEGVWKVRKSCHCEEPEATKQSDAVVASPHGAKQSPETATAPPRRDPPGQIASLRSQ